MSNFSKLLANYLGSHNISRSELARRSHLAKSTISKLCSNTAHATYATCKQLSDNLIDLDLGLDQLIRMMEADRKNPLANPSDYKASNHKNKGLVQQAILQFVKPHPDVSVDEVYKGLEIYSKVLVGKTLSILFYRGLVRRRRRGIGKSMEYWI